ncbi:hypothetical protein FGO68_gene2065 [Halteria grandinella]|uniref:Uncharacterized protein n=1 Tax=Halteria grandinella TaxID=5974 RepID=A0A8J8NIM0_HALGN|nr:hypothetical protein FGO68_gene2065 [Halteria grandinella]
MKSSPQQRVKVDSPTKHSFNFGGGKLFAGQRGFDPATIILQIVSLQFTYYLTLSLCLYVTTSLCYGLNMHMGQVFSPLSLNSALPPDYAESSMYRAPTVLGHLLNMPLTIASLAYTVEKANKILDFTVTIFFYHLMATWLSNKFPWEGTWWLWHAIFVTVTVLSGEWICLKLETAEIKLSFGHIVEKGKEMIEDGISKMQQESQPKKKSSKKPGHVSKKNAK